MKSCLYRAKPSGDHFASVGADGKVLIYDGSTGEYVASMPGADADGHKGTIFALSWSQDSKSISTSGADRTVKVVIIHPSFYQIYCRKLTHVPFGLRSGMLRN